MFATAARLRPAAATGQEARTVHGFRTLRAMRRTRTDGRRFAPSTVLIHTDRMSTTRSTARRPRRPGHARHDASVPDASEILDDHSANLSPAGAAPLAQTPLAAPSPVVCAEVLLLRSLVDCPACGQRTPVFAMIGSPEFDTAERTSTMLRRIAALPAELDVAARTFSKGRWRRDQVQAGSGSVWQSHCQKCERRIDEAWVLGPAGPFQPTLYKQRAAIKAEPVSGPFVLAAVQRLESPVMVRWLDWHRQRPSKSPRRRAAAGRKAARSAVDRGHAP